MVLASEHQSRNADMGDTALNAREVGKEFVYIYYLGMNKCPQDLHRFYSNASLFVHGGREKQGQEAPPIVGQMDIASKIGSLNLKDCRTKILMVDAMPAPKDCVLIQVCGEISNDNGQMRRFMQTFLLAPNGPKKFYVQCNIFRYQDEVFTDTDDLEMEQPIIADMSEPQQQQQQRQEDAFAEPEPSFGAIDNHHLQGAPAPSGFADDNHSSTVVNGDGQLGDSADAFLTGGSQLRQEEQLQPVLDEPDQASVGGAPAAEVAAEAPSCVPKETKKKPFSSLFGGAGPVASAPQPVQQQQQPLPQRRPPQQQPQQQQPQQQQQHNGSHPTTSSDNPPAAGRDEGYQIFVGNLQPDVREDELSNYFEQWGTVVSCRITSGFRAKATGQPNFAFVGFENPESVRKVLSEKNLSLNNNRLNVEEKKSSGGSNFRRQGRGGGGRSGPRR